MQHRTAFTLAATFLVSTASLAAVPVPVSVRLVDPGNLTLTCGNTTFELPLTPSVEWVCGTASGTIDTSIDESGLVHASSSGTASGSMRISLVRRATIEFDVPDYGESMTAIALVPTGGDFDPTSYNGTIYAGLNGYPHSSILGLPVENETVETVAYVRIGATSLKHAGFGKFISGDTLTVEEFYWLVTVDCNSCSWTTSPDFQLFAIAPEPQNRPQTECYDQTDNDGDGLVDLADSDCGSPNDLREGGFTTAGINMAGWGCGLGHELVQLLPLLGWRRS